MRTAEQALRDALDSGGGEAVIEVHAGSLRETLAELARLRAIEQRVIHMRDEARPVGDRRPGPKYRNALAILGTDDE